MIKKIIFLAAVLTVVASYDLPFNIANCGVYVDIRNPPTALFNLLFNFGDYSVKEVI